MFSMLIFSFAFILVSCQVNYPINYRGQISQGNSIFSDTFRVNANVGSELAIQHTFALQLCFKTKPISEFVLPLYWNITCDEYYTYPQSPDIRKPIVNVDTVLLRDTFYWVGIALLDPLNSTVIDDIIFSFGTPGDNCPFGTVYIPSTATCLTPTLIPAKYNGQITMKKDELKYFTFDVPPLASSLTAFMPNSQNGLIFVIGYMMTPTNLHHDGQAGSTAYLPFPKPGKCILRIRAATDLRNANFSLRYEFCNNPNYAGPNCKTFYNTFNQNSLNIISNNGIINYWRVFVPPGKLTSVSMRPNDNEDFQYYGLYASLGQLPQPNNADLSYCYGRNCSSVRTIVFPNDGSTTTTWYIGILPYKNNRSKYNSYGIWFNSLCAPDCTEHGMCYNDGEREGYCECVERYTGCGCQILR